MTARVVMIELARLEAAHLVGIVGQFLELVTDAAPDDRDPAIGRLVPPAYADETDAREFRDLTETHLLDRRRTDAALVLASLTGAAELPDDPDDPALLESVEVRLDPEMAQAWLRTLAAVRLVLATRLEITGPEDHDSEDPRFGIYDWLDYRLDGLVAALDGGA